MTAERKLDLLEERPLPKPRHWIPSDRMRFIAESADQHWIARLERFIGKCKAILRNCVIAFPHDPTTP